MIVVFSVLLVLCAAVIAVQTLRLRRAGARAATRPLPGPRPGDQLPAGRAAELERAVTEGRRAVQRAVAERDSARSELRGARSELEGARSERDGALTERDRALARAADAAREAETAAKETEGARSASDRAGAGERRARGEAEEAQERAARLLTETEALRERAAKAEERARREAESARRARKEAEEYRKALEPLDDPDWVQSELDEMRRLATNGGTLPPVADADRPATDIPQQLPLSPDATTDSVLDGADLGALVVRAASVCGDGHRRRQQHRRDAVLLRVPVGMGRPTLLSAVAAGTPDGVWSQSAAQHACRALLTQIQNHAAVLGPWLHDEAAAEVPGPAAALRLALNDVGQAIRVEARGRGWVSAEGTQDDRAVGVALTGLLSPLGDSGTRTHLAFGVGDGMVLRLRDRTWTTVFPAGDQHIGEATPLPVKGAPVRWLAVPSREGDRLVVCTRPTAQLLLNEVTGSWFADRWTDGQPRLTSFLLQLSARIRGAVEDRTMACVWDHGYASHAAETRYLPGNTR
ncbi:hypothetical protein ABZ782_23115 [Streptomyces asoensis]|uniref:hypothetical protein n=1 Tax=Streptomyces asoensis TaxID=249586 RepID=UPI0033F42F76